MNVFGRRGVKIGGTIAAGYLIYYYDKNYQASAIRRNIRALYTGAMIAIDYKLNFTKEKAEKIEELHTRVANRMYHLCITNGGMYIKFGQQIASVQVLPPAYRIFRKLYDNAPHSSLEEIEKIITDDFEGKRKEDIFDEFSEKPIASASIAQVHKAKLKSGEEVAVKIQKPEIAKQMEMDLLTFRVLVYSMSWLFDLPMYWYVDYVTSQFRKEIDFITEGKNSERAYREMSKELKRKAYIPKVYWESTTKRVLTMEWIEGIRFSDKETMFQKEPQVKEIVKTIVEVFAYQIFSTGFIHGDPHLGNIIVRRNPNDQSQPQVVILDHGLYVEAGKEFRENYCRFWKSLFTLDYETLNNIAMEWGIQDVTLFASATLQRPWKKGKMLHLDSSISMSDVYEMQMKARENLQSFLENMEHLPKELIFVGRNLNLVRANNQIYGSLVNRINIMAEYAVQGIGNDFSTTSKGGFTSSLRITLNFLTFRLTLFTASLAFWISRTFSTIGSWFGRKEFGYEDLLESSIKDQIFQQFGITIDESTFDA